MARVRVIESWELMARDILSVSIVCIRTIMNGLIAVQKLNLSN